MPVHVAPQPVPDGEEADGATGSQPGGDVQRGRGDVNLLQQHALWGHDGRWTHRRSRSEWTQSAILMGSSRS